jgi:hypothetical protein
MPKITSISKWLFGTATSWLTHIKRSKSKKKEVNHENNRRIGSKHCIGEYFVLSYGDGCPSYAS